MPIGRYAPSPSGDLHVGNLRTGLLAWLFAHADGGELRLRIDDLDPNVSSSDYERRQLADLDSIGIGFDGVVIRQSKRTDEYRDAIASLIERDLTYSCFCSRREVREAAAAPHLHLPEGAYPGTCRDLSESERQKKAADRPAALRIRAEAIELTYIDRVYGEVTGIVDDFVVQRNDGVPSYNLATVLDDAEQGVDEVVRGADLVPGTVRQIWLRDVLGLPQTSHAHVPLMMNVDGERLAKRDGAVTIADLSARGWSADEVRGLLAASIGLADIDEAPTPHELLARFDPAAVPTEPSTWADPPQKASSETV